MKGAVVQGSNDNATWTTLTPAAVSSPDWQWLKANGAGAYRYIRIFNSSSWFGNMAEVRLHGAVKAQDVTPPVTTDDAPQGWVNSDATVRLAVADSESGAAATYYTINGGAPQTGNIVTLTDDGMHTLTYWSEDRAGNQEQPHTVSLKIDKTAPLLSFTLDPSSIWPANHDMVTVQASIEATDAGSGLASVVLTSITYNQPDSGMGDIIADFGTEAASFQLRAEKSRVYTVTYTATDQAGNQTTATAEVTVPHDQRP